MHALARMLEVTSREVLAHLQELGVTARSASSSISGEQAQSVADRLAAPEAPAADEQPVADESAPEAPAPAADVAVTESLFSAIVVEEPTTAAAGVAETAPLFLPPTAPVEPTQPKSPEPQSTEAKSTEAKSTEAKSTEPKAETPEADTAASEDKPAEAAADEAQTDEAQTDESAESDSDNGENGEGEASGSQRARRRRRGRRGRGRGRGDAAETDGDDNDDATADKADAGAGESAAAAAAADQPEAEQTESEKTESAETGSGESSADESAEDTKDDENGDSATDDATQDDESEDGDDSTTPSSKRRRRRRRRRSGSDSGSEDEAASDDPPNTVVHEREPRARRQRDEVQGISGSTRLEAKRQRRRDGRDAGRRRPPILSESEFLARRESVERVMVVRERKVDPAAAAADPHLPAKDYTQVAVLEDGVLVEHFVTTETSQSMVGNIYLGRVQNVLPGMEAAFVDIGRGRNGVLYAGEVNWEAAGLNGGARKIEQALKPGDSVLVQVSKDPVGHKGARLTTQISLAGRYLVYVPGGTSTGISRKLPDTERRRLKSILTKLVPDEAGVIIRTASEGVSAEELGADITRLEEQWKGIEAAAAEHQAKASGTTRAMYEEPDLLVRVVRDLFNEDFTKLVVEGDRAWDQVSGYVGRVAPDLSERVSQFTKDTPTAADSFGVYRIDEQLAKALDRKVWLPSGGTLIIEHTEAMTVVDVNTGKFTGAGGNLEETVTRNNLEAAEEIVRQMRLRDIGGMIIVDFIDMVLESNRDLVLRRLTEALARDRTRHQVSEVTSLGLVQMTRKRLGTGLLEAFSTTCTTCHGRGLIVHTNPVEVRTGGDDSTRGDAGGSKRSRRSKRRSDKPDTPGEGGASEAKAPEAKAPHKPAAEHPMFKSMAHHDEDEAADAAENSVVADTPVADQQVDDKPAQAERTESKRPERQRTDSTRAESAPVAQQVVEPAVVAEPVVEDAPSEPAGPVVTRRRRVRRAVAPSAPAEPVVITTEAPVTTGAAAPTTEPVVEITRRPRRRGGRRSAGASTQE
ncbi:translation initiation factor IF-2 N-terminal domain-containing protein [Gordonia alkaliphila]|uniref:Rne/Rng family ribonuclease n=1 Tax=Gordonia alkaliphila TaxID=1053547 RepID=UPI001FF683B1|nr:Rne/Rng family ribonuclease [Gordonia alkaliphila]MCK0440295.1 translation initiation factor IF-2 N-terminal domain-containing protein [Gordonia alkaliphila]